MLQRRLVRRRSFGWFLAWFLAGSVTHDPGKWPKETRPPGPVGQLTPDVRGRGFEACLPVPGR